MSESSGVSNPQSTPRQDGEPGSDETPSKADIYIETGLTPSEYICDALERAGGRLKQQAICAFTGWSEPTISRTLSEMEDAGTIARVQLGTEKLVYLPRAEPDLTSISVGTG